MGAEVDTARKRAEIVVADASGGGMPTRIARTANNHGEKGRLRLNRAVRLRYDCGMRSDKWEFSTELSLPAAGSTAPATKANPCGLSLALLLAFMCPPSSMVAGPPPSHDDSVVGTAGVALAGTDEFS